MLLIIEWALLTVILCLAAWHAGMLLYFWYARLQWGAIWWWHVGHNWEAQELYLGLVTLYLNHRGEGRWYFAWNLD